MNNVINIWQYTDMYLCVCVYIYIYIYIYIHTHTHTHYLSLEIVLKKTFLSPDKNSCHLFCLKISLIFLILIAF